MAQTLRPDSNVTQTNITGGFADIDEASSNDADRAYPTGVGSAVFEFGFSNPTGSVGGPATFNYRLYRCNTGTGAPNAGPSETATMTLYQGGVLIATDTTRSVGTTGTTYAWTPNVSAVTDWTDIRGRLTQSAGAQSVGIMWAELQVEDAVTGTLAATEAADTFAASGMVYDRIEGALIATEAQDTFDSGADYPYLPIYGTPNVCPRCGERTPVREMKKEWTGQRVCSECWDPRPAETRPPYVRPEGLPLPGANPEPPPVFGRIEP